MIEYLDLLMFAAAILVLLLGFPVAFSLAGVAIIFALLGDYFGVFPIQFLKAIPQRIFGTMTNEVLMAVPLFIFMGTILEKSKVAEDLLENMSKLFRHIRGGLGISVTLVGALLAASTGIVGATVVTMGLLSLPTMLKNGYDTKLATGVITAAGTLGQIIPPSIVLILLGDVISNAYQQSQLEMGIFSPDTVSVGDLFAGSLIPGLLLVSLYILYQFFKAFSDPESTPEIKIKDNNINYILLLKALFPPLTLIIAVLGSILSGFATPTEAASVGAIGSILLASNRIAKDNFYSFIATFSFILLLVLNLVFDLRLNRDNLNFYEISFLFLALIIFSIFFVSSLISIYKLFLSGVLFDAARSSTKITSMVFIILIGATFFSLVFRGLGGDETIEHFLTNLPGGTFSAILIVMIAMFLLGFFLDFIEITFVVVPIVAPIILQMGIDPVWLGVMMAINLQTSFLTPPFGFALFYLRGVAPNNVKTSQIYRGVIPFILIQMIMLILLSAFPIIATWLPTYIFN